MLAHKDDFTLSQPPFLRYVTGESVWTRLHTQSSKRPTYLCSCYIPNTHSAVTGLEHLRDTLSLIFSHHRHTQPLIYIAGDFNLGDIDWTNNVTTNPQTATYHQRLLDLMDEFGLNNIQHDISRPCSGKCLDLILTNHPKSVITSNTDSGMSDHLLIDFTINCKPPKVNKIAHKVYVFKKAEPEVIKSAINEISDQFFARNVSEITVNNNWSFFRDGIHKVMKNNIPSKMSKTRHNLPWVSTSIKREMRKRDRLLTQAKKSKKTEDWNKFKAQRNKIPKLIKHSYHEYINSVIGNALVNNPKTFWSYVRRTNTENMGIPTLIDIDGKTHVTPQAKAERLCNHFESQYQHTGDTDLPNISPSPHPCIPKLTIGLDGVKRCLQAIHPNKACGPDEIPARIYHDYAHELAPMLRCIYQQSYNEGQVPDDWKSATVCAVHKKGATSDAKNYRPISLTVLACKFMEHICASHINKFLANTHILNSKQHGFRQGLSCQTQLIEAVNDWVCSLNSKRGAKTCQITVALFDFSKAFDRVCHKRLLLKLDFYGIRGPMREWIDSFLQDRTQTVSIQGVKSSSIHVVSGVPQGSVLGPLLFLLFINDIDNNIQSPLRLFADDTILYREIWSKDDHNIIQNDIQTLFKWSQTWKLDFNVTKCKVLTISNKKDPDKFNYTLNTDPLEHVDSHQYLGVTINSKLRWNTHVSAITAKATRTLNVIRRTLHPCHPEVKKVAYMSLVRPKLEYSSAAWNPHTQNDTTQLEKVQRNAARFILSDYERKSSVTDMLYKLNLDTLERRRQHHMVKTFHKVFYGHDGINIPASIIPSQRDNLKFVQPASRINCHLYSFYPRAIRFWNLLPFHLRNMNDMDAFGQSLTAAVVEKMSSQSHAQVRRL